MEFKMPTSGTVVKAILFVECASQMAVIHPLWSRSATEHRNATAEEVVKAMHEAWIGHYPRPLYVRYDPEGCFVSDTFQTAMSSLNIQMRP
eukprot:508225-Alexandrium_andersonii.AAC.1